MICGHRGHLGDFFQKGLPDTTHVTALYAHQLTPLAPPQLIGKYTSPMECLGLAQLGFRIRLPVQASEAVAELFTQSLGVTVRGAHPWCVRARAGQVVRLTAAVPSVSVDGSIELRAWGGFGGCLGVGLQFAPNRLGTWSKISGSRHRS